MFEEFIHPCDPALYAGENYAAWQLGPSVLYNVDPYGMDIAIIGVKEDRASVKNNGCSAAPDIVRSKLFSLARLNHDIKIIDLGNIEQGATVRDTYIALSKVANELIRMRILPVIIGGSHDLTCGQFAAYQDLNRMINITIVDNTADLKEDSVEINDESFLLNAFSHDPGFIFNFHLIAYQTHLTSGRAIEILERLHFETYRLGKVKSEIAEMEPVIRGTNLFSIDMCAIRLADASGNRNSAPTGLMSEDACQLAWYAGQSDQVDSFGIYGSNPSVDMDDQTSQLAADMIWYFMDGYYNRKSEYPGNDDADYTKYTVHFKENKYELNFWKSKKTDHWWMEVPTGEKPSNRKKFHLIPCSYSDYQMACREELPERWIKAQQKLS